MHPFHTISIEHLFIYTNDLKCTRRRSFKKNERGFKRNKYIYKLLIRALSKDTSGFKVNYLMESQLKNKIKITYRIG